MNNDAIREAFEAYWNNYGELHASMCGKDIKLFASEFYMSGSSSKDKEVTELKEQVKESMGYVDDMIKDRDAFHDENEKLEEALTLVLFYMKNGEVEARKAGTCYINIIEKANKALSATKGVE